MTLEWFDAVKAVQFGNALADFFIERIPGVSIAIKSRGKGLKLAPSCLKLDRNSGRTR